MTYAPFCQQITIIHGCRQMHQQTYTEDMKVSLYIYVAGQITIFYHVGCRLVYLHTHTNGATNQPINQSTNQSIPIYPAICLPAYTQICLYIYIFTLLLLYTNNIYIYLPVRRAERPWMPSFSAPKRDGAAIWCAWMRGRSLERPLWWGDLDVNVYIVCILWSIYIYIHIYILLYAL
jgi:hypothetical protein